MADGAGVNVIAAAGEAASDDTERRKEIVENGGLRAARRRRKGNRIAFRSMRESRGLQIDHERSPGLEVASSELRLLGPPRHVRKAEDRDWYSAMGCTPNGMRRCAREMRSLHGTGEIPSNRTVRTSVVVVELSN